jgi:uncharacterized membrane protein
MDSLLRGNALLALAAAVLWGGGDFSGGMAVRSAGGGVRAALRVVIVAHLASLIVLLAIARLRGDVFPYGALLGWGLAAGVAGGLSLTCFYVALSRGAMGASAALSGLLAAAIPAALTLWQMGSPGGLPVLGFAVAGAAIWLIAGGSTETSGEATARGTGALAMIAGVGFGLYFVALKLAGPAGVIWPMATARIGSLTVCSLTMLGLRVKHARFGLGAFDGAARHLGQPAVYRSNQGGEAGRCCGAGVVVSGFNDHAGGVHSGRAAYAAAGSGNGRRCRCRLAYRRLR